jgi:hypothetical protein
MTCEECRAYQNVGYELQIKNAELNKMILKLQTELNELKKEIQESDIVITKQSKLITLLQERLK